MSQKIIWKSKIKGVKQNLKTFNEFSDKELINFFKSEKTEEWAASALLLGRRASSNIELTRFILNKLNQDANIHHKRHAFTALGALITEINKKNDQKETLNEHKRKEVIKLLDGTVFDSKDLKGLKPQALIDSIKISILCSFLSSDEGKGSSFQMIINWIEDLPVAVDKIEKQLNKEHENKIRIKRELKEKGIDTSGISRQIENYNSLLKEIEKKAYGSIEANEILRFLGVSDKLKKIDQWCILSFLFAVPDLKWPIDRILIIGIYEKTKVISNLAYILSNSYKLIPDEIWRNHLQFLIEKASIQVMDPISLFEEVLDLYYIYCFENSVSYLEFIWHNFPPSRKIIENACNNVREDSEENIFMLGRFLLSELSPRYDFFKKYPYDEKRTSQFWIILLSVLTIQGSRKNKGKVSNCKHPGMKPFQIISIIEEKIEEFLETNEDIICNLVRILKMLYYDTLREEKNEKQAELLILRQQVFISKLIESRNWRATIEKDAATITIRVLEEVLRRKGFIAFLFHFFVMEKYIPTLKVLEEVKNYTTDDRINEFLTKWENTEAINSDVNDSFDLKKITKEIAKFIENNFSDPKKNYGRWFHIIIKEESFVGENKEFIKLLRQYLQVKSKIEALRETRLYKNLISFLSSDRKPKAEDLDLFMEVLEAKGKFLGEKRLDEYKSIVVEIKRYTIEEEGWNLEEFQRINEIIPELIEQYNKLKIWIQKEFSFNQYLIITKIWLNQKIKEKEKEYDFSRDFLIDIKNSNEKGIIKKLGLKNKVKRLSLKPEIGETSSNIIRIIERWMYNRFMLDELITLKTKNFSLSQFWASILKGFLYKFHIVFTIIAVPFILWIVSQIRFLNFFRIFANFTIKIYALIILVSSLAIPTFIIFKFTLYYFKKKEAKKTLNNPKEIKSKGVQLYHLFFPKIAGLLLFPTLAQLADEIWSYGMNLGNFGPFMAFIYMLFSFWIIKGVIMGNITNITHEEKNKRTFQVLSIAFIFSFFIQLFFMILNGKMMANRLGYDVSQTNFLLGIPRHLELSFTGIPVVNIFFKEIMIFPLMLLVWTSAVLFVGIALQIFISKDKVTE